MKFKNTVIDSLRWLALVIGFMFASMISSQAANVQSMVDPQQIIQSPLRTDQDRAIDVQRKPVDMLNFIQAKPGMKVLDIFSGAGYTTQLMALAVGQTGQVVAMNIRLNAALQERLADHPQSNIMPVIATLQEISAGPGNQFDIITIVNSYHDMINSSPDIVVSDQRIYDLLKPGGVLIVRDHAAKEGAGKSVTKTLHRIEPAAVLFDFELVGFKKVQEGSFLKSSQDKKELHSYQMNGIAPEGFIYKFIKPEVF